MRGSPHRHHHASSTLSLSKGTFVLINTIIAAMSFYVGSISCSFSCISELQQQQSNIWMQEQQVRQLDEVAINNQQQPIENNVIDNNNNADNNAADSNNNNNTCEDEFFPAAKMERFLTGMTRVNKNDFTDTFEMGVPIDQFHTGAENVVVIFNRHSRPTTDIPMEMTAKDALVNCDSVNMVLTHYGDDRRQCIAIVPQYESYHILKYMRINKKTDKLDGSIETFSQVGRGRQTSGKDSFSPPQMVDFNKHWNMLKNYLNNLETVLQELKEILDKIAVNNTVIVMVCNFGQSELLMNFVCHARQHKLDLSNIIVFTTDQETTDLVISLGLAVYYDKRNFDDVPSDAARRYGDRKFVAMMMAKVICVQLVSMLGFDFLFQDVDIIWFQNPLEYFTNDSNNDNDSSYDIYFQDDGGHSVRYAPYSANSGFYFVRYNDRTRHFFTSLLMAGDLVLKTDSHQQALIALLGEHVSLYGLRAKVLSRDTDEFPGGYHWNMRSQQYMHDFYDGKVKPLIFHMSWTLNKDNKILYFKQMGEWYTEEKCIQKHVKDITGSTDSSVDIRPTCCTAEPLISCHYRDKPSIKPCLTSPNIDKGRPSFWKDTKREKLR